MDRRLWSVLLLVAGAWLVWQLQELVVLAAVAFVFAAALVPVVRWLDRRGLPHWASVGLCFAGFFGLMGGLLAYLVPLIAAQARELATSLPTASDQLDVIESRWSDWNETLPFVPRFSELTGWVSEQTTALVQSFIGWTGRFVVMLAGLISILFLGFFFLLDGRKLSEQLFSLWPPESRERVRRVGKEVTVQVGHYMFGRLVVMVAVGVLTGVMLAVAGVPYSAVLGLIAGLLDIIPFIGPVVAAVPGILIAFSISWQLGVVVTLLYWAIQSLESYVLTPGIVGKTVGLHPVWIFLALLVGERLLGVTGLILAVPAAVAIQVLIRSVYLARLGSTREVEAVDSALEQLTFPATKDELLWFADKGPLTQAPLEASARERLRVSFLRLPEGEYEQKDGVIAALRQNGGFEQPPEEVAKDPGFR